MKPLQVKSVVAEGGHREFRGLFVHPKSSAHSIGLEFLYPLNLGCCWSLSI